MNNNDEKTEMNLYSSNDRYLDDLIRDLRNHPGLLRKQNIGSLLEILPQPQAISNRILADFGEDSALIIQNADNIILFHSDAIVEPLVERNPYGAGMSCVLVNVNDIFAAAGTPVALTCIVSYKNDTQGGEIARQLMDGAAKAVHLFQVPIVGGHTASKCSYNAISMSCIGIGKRDQILKSSTARPGDLILAAVDLVGQRGAAYRLGWDCFTFKTSYEVLTPRNAMIEIGKRQLATASKDSSNPGILGSMAMLLEASGRGGIIQIEAIPRPDSVPLREWVKMFISTGFILTCPENNATECLQVLKKGGLTAKIVGQVLEDSCVYLANKEGEQELFFDFSKESIFGAPLKSPR